MKEKLSHAMEWFEDRTGLPSALRRFGEMSVPGGPRWRHTLGWALVALLVVEAVTGLALMTVYSPHPTAAWSSIFYLQEVLPWGRLVRAMHRMASHGMVVLMGLHLGAVLFKGAHRRPRELTWWIGLGLAGLVLAFCITGFPLAWDQRGYWSSRVETGIMGSVPVAGPWIQRFFQGGTHYGALTLTRFYTLHVAVLPLIVAGLVAAHVAMVRRHGLYGPTASSDPEERWWPSQAARDAVMALVAVAVVVLAARRFPVPMDAPADPQSHYPAVPEWYFMPLSALLKHFTGRLQIVGTMVIPGALGGYLAAMPFFERGPTPNQRVRAVAMIPLVIAGAAAVTLGMELKAATRQRDFARATEVARQRGSRSVVLARRGIPPEGPLEMVRWDPENHPRELFVQHCGHCHTVAGVSRQRKGPRLDGFGSRQWASAFVTWPTHPELMGTTRIDDMPPQLRRLREDGVRAASEWLHSRGQEPGTPQADPALALQGEGIYRRRCTICHLGAGDLSETDLSERDAPNLDGWGSRAWIRGQIVTPHLPEFYGARNRMPRFGDKLSERELGMIVDYVYGLRLRAAPTVRTAPTPPPAAAEP